MAAIAELYPTPNPIGASYTPACGIFAPTPPRTIMTTTTASIFTYAHESSWNGSGPLAVRARRLWQLAARWHGDEKASSDENQPLRPPANEAFAIAGK